MYKHAAFVLGTLAGVLLAAPVLVSAGALALPNTFANGTIADATEVNANFAAIDTEVDDNAARLATLEAALTTETESVTVSNPFGGPTTLDVTYARVGTVVTATFTTTTGLQTSGSGGSQTVTMDS